MPMVPPSSQPQARATSSMPVRTRRIDGPRSARPVMIPSRGSGPEAGADVHADPGTGDDQPGDEQGPLRRAGRAGRGAAG